MTETVTFYRLDGICRYCGEEIFRRRAIDDWQTVYVLSCDTYSCARPDGAWVANGHLPAMTRRPTPLQIMRAYDSCSDLTFTDHSERTTTMTEPNSFRLEFSDEAWEWMYEIIATWADKGLTVTLADGRDVELVGMSTGNDLRRSSRLLFRVWLAEDGTPAIGDVDGVRLSDDLDSIPLYDDDGLACLTYLRLT